MNTPADVSLGDETKGVLPILSPWWDLFPKSSHDAQTFDLKALVQFMSDNTQVKIGNNQTFTWDTSRVSVVQNLEELKDLPDFFDPIPGHSTTEELRSAWDECQKQKKPFLIKSVRDGTISNGEVTDLDAEIHLTWIYLRPIEKVVPGVYWRHLIWSNTETFVKFHAVQIRGMVHFLSQ
jgi:hypothetical protein